MNHSDLPELQVLEITFESDGRFCPEDNSMTNDTQSMPMVLNSSLRQPRCRRTLANR